MGGQNQILSLLCFRWAFKIHQMVPPFCFSKKNRIFFRNRIDLQWLINGDSLMTGQQLRFVSATVMVASSINNR